MPIVGWIHPVTQETVALDHFDRDKSVGCTCGAVSGDHSRECQGRPAYPPWLARKAALKIRSDLRHTGLTITTTTLLGCPREWFLSRLFDYHISPKATFMRDRGTEAHSMAASGWNPETHLNEHDHATHLTVKGTLFGLHLEGLIDAAAFTGHPPCVTEIIDTKFPSDFSVNFRRKQHGVAKPEHAFQLNVNRLLMAQQPWAIEAGYDPDRVLLTIWDHAQEPEPLAAPHMTEEELLSIRPFGGRYSVADILDLMQSARAMREKGDDPEEVGARLPLVGESMMNNRKCGSYCDVEPLCSRLVRQYGRPQETA